MRWPGERARSFFARWCTDKMMRQRIDPAIADVQAEYRHVRLERRVWHGRWVLVAGYVALAKLGIVCAWHSAGEAIEDCTATDLRALGRLLLGCGLLTASFTALVVWNGTRDVLFFDDADPGVAVFLIPYGLAVALPPALLLALVWALDGSASRSLRGAVVSCALVASVVTLVNLGWITPSTNQSFRTAVLSAAGAVGEVSKGFNELTFPELWQRYRTGRHGDQDLARAAGRSYYSRWSIAFAPIVFAMVALSLRGRRRVRRVSAGIGVMALWWVLLLAASRLAPVSHPALVFWLPPAALAAYALWNAASSAPQQDHA